MSSASSQESAVTKNRHVMTSAIILLVSGILIAVLAWGLKLDQSKIPSTIVGKTAYPFRAEWIQGRESLPHATDATFTLDHARGHTVVLNFWASWCISCKEEARELEAFWQLYKEKNVKVIGIAIQDTQEAAQKFASYFGKTYILGLDYDGRISIDYGVTGVPETFIINKEGVVVHKEVGPVTVETLEKFVKPLL